MAKPLQVKLPMPSYTGRFTASYSNVTKLTGIQYILMSFINSQSRSNLSWKDVMNSMGITDEIFNELFIPELQKMYGTEIDCNHAPHNFRQSDMIRDYRFTEHGKEDFARGVIAVETHGVKGEITYCPGKSDEQKYSETGRSNIVELKTPCTKKFKTSTIEPSVAEAFVSHRRTDFGIDEKDAEIFDFSLDGNQNSVVYEQPIDVLFDSVSGEFRIYDRYCDLGFLKNTYTGQEILNYIDKTLFENKYAHLIFDSADEDSDDWNSYSFMLPSEVDFKKDRYTVCKRNRCEIDKDDGTVLYYDNLKSDILSIQSANIGYEYKLMKMDITVRGFDGHKKGNLILKRVADKKSISDTLKLFVISNDIGNIDKLNSSVEFLPLIDDPAFEEDLLIKHLVTCENLVISITRIKQIKGLKTDLSSILESAFDKLGLSTQRQIDILKKTDMKVRGDVISSSIDSTGTDDSLKDADALIGVVTNKMGLLMRTGIDDPISHIVLDGLNFEPTSEEFQKAQRCHVLISELKKKLRMRSADGNEFDIDNIDESIADDLTAEKTELNSLINTIKGMMIDEVMRKEIENFITFFNDIAQTLKSSTNISKARGRNLGILLGVELEDIFRSFGLSGTLDEMILQAAETGTVSEEDVKVLTSIRKFRNECAHRMTLENVPDEKKRKKWISLIKKLGTSKKVSNNGNKG